MSLSVIGSTGEFDAHLLRIDRNNELKKKFGISYTRFAEIDPAPIKRWLVKDFLGAGEMSCAYGPPGSAKSLLAGDLAAHIAWGQDWMGRRVSQGTVLFIAIERSGLVKRRLAGISQHYGIADLPLAVVSGAIDLCHGRSGVDAILESARRLSDETEGDVCLVAIDTVSRALAGGNENSSEDMGALVQNVLHIQEGTGAHVLLTHHVPHDQNRMRGHGALLAACDTTLRIESNGDLRTATVEKTNDGAEGERVSFAIETVELGQDMETGDVTSAPVVRPAEVPKAVARAPKLRANQQTMYTLLRSAGQAGLNVEEWNKRAKDIGIGIKRPADLYDFRDQLMAKQLVYESGGRWFCTA
jgi:hypothetical protein